MRECIEEARAKKVAVGHFNISSIDALWAIFHAAQNLKVPVIIGTSEGEDAFIGHAQAAALVRSLREEFDYPVYLNADHHYSFEEVKRAIDAGYDAVIFDGAKLSFEENVRITKQCVEYAKNSGRDVLVEAELGYIGSSSKLLNAIPEGAAVKEEEMTSIEAAVKFVKETGVNLFSPAIGSIHGMLRATHDPDVSVARIREIASAVPVPLVLHGASGLTDENMRAAIEAGISLVHINTEIRVAWRDAVKLSLQDNPDEVAPYKILKPAMQAIQKVVESHLRLFNNIQ